MGEPWEPAWGESGLGSRLSVEVLLWRCRGMGSHREQGPREGLAGGRKGCGFALSAVAWEPERSHRRPNAGIVSEGGLPGQVTPRSRDQKAHRLASTCESCSL